MSATLQRSRIRRLEDALSIREPRRTPPTAAAPRDGGSARAVSMQYDEGHRPALHCHQPTRTTESAWAPKIHDLVQPATPRMDAYATDVGLLVAAEDNPGQPQPDPTVAFRTGETVDQSAGPADGTFQARPAGPVAPSDAEPVSGWQVAPRLTQTDDEAFAQDVLAIVAHANSVGNQSTRTPLPDAPTSHTPPPVDPDSSKGVGMAAGHDVFDRIAAASTPNRYDQGPVALAVDFSRLDKALNHGPDAGTQPQPQHEAGKPQAPLAAMPPVITPAPAEQPAVVSAAGPREADPENIVGVTARAAPFRITADVPLLAQATGLSCHAAACASIVAWRDDIIPDAAAVSSASGYWERYADGRTAAFPDVLEAFGLRIASAGAAPTPTAVRDLMDAHGPLWLAASPPGEHALVLAGLTGDGTADGTLVDIVDPWARGMTAYAAPNPGSRYSMPYADVVCTLAGGQILLAHLKEGSQR